MKHFTPAALILAAFAGSTLAADGTCTHTGCSSDQRADTTNPAMDEAVLERIAGSLIHSLPKSEQQKIVDAEGIGSHALDLSHFTHEVDRSRTAHIDPDITIHEYRDMLISDELEARMDETQHKIVDRIVEQIAAGVQPPMMCFAPDADREYAMAINQLLEFRFQIGFQQTSRWSSTAISGNGLVQGQPTTITYSFAPDGTFVPNIIGVTGNSNFNAWMNGIYGNQATWQPIYDQVFARWAELTGTSYVYEPNDDGSNLNTGGGIVGVRGDVRIAAITIDGNSGTLAYNNFPNDGDMVFDSADAFYNSTGGNSLGLRNVIAHEHGHGLGMLHVCPIQNNKLMEPFLSTAFDGPQLDDILNGHRHYGDPNEPNDTPGTSTLLDASAGVNDFGFLDNVSVDDNSDDDFYELTLNEPGLVQVVIGPDAATITQGPQTSQCNTGTSTNYNTRLDLRISVFSSSDFFNPIASVDATGLGGEETISFEATTAGSYFIRVDTSSTNNRVQRYDGVWSITDLPFLAPTLSAATPDSIDPGTTSSFNVTIDPREDTLDGTPQLFTSVNNGPFTSSPLASNGGTSYTATLPAVDCDDSLEYYISAIGDVSGELTLPSAGAGAPFVPSIGEFVVEIDDNFETNQGWTVSGSVATADAGRWERATPAHGNDGRVSDPGADFDGSGQCYITGNVADNSDVDGGDTILTSPVFDLSSNPGAVVSYARWFDNNEAGSASNAFTETFIVEISDNNGSSWTQLEEVGPTGAEVSGGWFQVSFPVADFVSTTDSVRVRFIAQDQDGTIVEAGVDAFSISGLNCEDPIVDECVPDLDGSGALDFGDVSEFLALFAAGDSSVDFDGSGGLDFGDVSAYLALFAAGCP